MRGARPLTAYSMTTFQERLGRGGVSPHGQVRFSPAEATKELEKAYADACGNRFR